MLEPGTRLGPYEIDASLGAGGMGEVYRAIDTRLRRTVAIKVMAIRWRERPDLRARFQIEAEAIAALNHPHIAQLYDVGQSDELDYLVMEHLEGETVAARLARGRLPLAQALAYATAIAEALGHAHRRGIVHRDVKPGNVMITSDGPKLLDFGVARTGDPPAGGSTVTLRERPQTEPGTMLGTWQYMAPEQLSGGPVDTRTDVFALGTLIYEMLAGRRAFHGTSPHELVTAILTLPVPDLQTLDPGVPKPLATLVSTCLAKEPGDRWATAADVAHALASVDLDAHGPVTGRWHGPTLRMVSVTVGIVAALVIGARALWTAWPTRTTPPIVRSTLALTSEVLPPEVDLAGTIAVTPDGRTIVYEASDRGRWQLYKWSLDGTGATAIPGTEDGRTPFFSPDGRWLAFRARTELKKVSMGGGTPIAIATIVANMGATWGPDDSIVLSVSGSGLVRLPARAGAPQPVPTIALAEGEDARWPQLLPDGKTILYAVSGPASDERRVIATHLPTGRHVELLRGVGAARFVPPGHLAYARSGELFLVRFDPRTLELSGTHQRVAGYVAEGPAGAPEYAFSADGHLVYLPGRHNDWQHRLMFVNMTGETTPIAAPAADIGSPRVSPDGTLIAYTLGNGHQLWVHDLERGSTTRVTDRPIEGWPVWSPDGRLTFAEGTHRATRIVEQSVTGARRVVHADAGGYALPESWQPAGSMLLYSLSRPGTGWDLWSLDRQVAKRPILDTPVDEEGARISPDGRWVLYTSGEGPNRSRQLFVRSLDGTSGRLQLSTVASRFAVWAPNGRRVYFRSPIRLPTRARPTPLTPEAEIVAVDLTLGTTLASSAPRPLFRNDGFGGPFDIMPDGTRFVMVALDVSPRSTSLALVQNVLANAR